MGGWGRAGSTTRGRRWREASFYAGVLSLLVALEPPFDRLADESFAIHMAQHVVLLTIVPPLVVLGRPWPRMWMPFPTRIRRAAVREIALGGWSAPLRAAARVLTRPPVALAAMSATVGVWHVPALLRRRGAQQHGAFRRARLLPRHRAPLLGTDAGGTAGAGPYRPSAPGRPVRGRPPCRDGSSRSCSRSPPRPLYGAYVSLQHRPGGISALADQQIAAGVMLVPGSAAFFIGFFISVYRWLEPPTALETQPEELSWT